MQKREKDNWVVFAFIISKLTYGNEFAMKPSLVIDGNWGRHA